jgi:hypothetical protein
MKTLYKLRNKSVTRKNTAKPNTLAAQMNKIIKNGCKADITERRALVRHLASKWNVDLASLLEDASHDDPVEPEPEVEPAVESVVTDFVDSDDEFPLTEEDYKIANDIESIIAESIKHSLYNKL